MQVSVETSWPDVLEEVMTDDADQLVLGVVNDGTQSGSFDGKSSQPACEKIDSQDEEDEHKRCCPCQFILNFVGQNSKVVDQH